MFSSSCFCSRSCRGERAEVACLTTDPHPSDRCAFEKTVQHVEETVQHVDVNLRILAKEKF